MRRYKEFLRVMRTIEGPRSKIKIVVSNHSLKEDWFNKPRYLSPSPNREKAPI